MCASVKRFFIITLLIASTSTRAMDQAGSQVAGQAAKTIVSEVAKASLFSRTGSAVVSGVKRVSSGVVSGAKIVGNGVAHGVTAVKNGVVVGTKAVTSGAAKGAVAVKDGVVYGVHTVTNVAGAGLNLAKAHPYKTAAVVVVTTAALVYVYKKLAKKSCHSCGCQTCQNCGCGCCRPNPTSTAKAN